VFNAVIDNLFKESVLKLLLAKRYYSLVAVVNNSRGLWAYILIFDSLGVIAGR
jgi:hypothetical protein